MRRSTTIAALALVLALAGYLRLSGAGWGELQHQHPDENHLVGVLHAIRAYECADPAVPLDACPPGSRRWIGPARYLDAGTSPLNPYNRGFSFYVYGNLPLTLVRAAVDLTEPADLRSFGRRASALADLLSLAVLYLIAARLYGSRIALLATLCSALAVLQIQQSHFFTTDLFVNLFALPALLCAVVITTRRPHGGHGVDTRDGLLAVAFAAAYGMALASKLSIAPLALVLPAAFALRHARESGLTLPSGATAARLGACLAAAAAAALLVFRVCQPYAFDGWGLDAQWVAGLQAQRAQAAGDGDVPWNLQWARRSYLFSFGNLTLWGLGLPLGLAAWSGFLAMGWRIARGQWHPHLLIWAWTAGYFLWQSVQFNPTMRYQLPIYPMLAIMAAWGLAQLARASRGAAVALGAAVVVLTAGWAFAFHGIYLREEPRVAASRWILQNVPGPATVRIATADGRVHNQPLAPSRDPAHPPHTFTFAAAGSGRLAEVVLPHVRLHDDAAATAGDRHPIEVLLSERPAPGPPDVLARAAAPMPAGRPDHRGDAVRVRFDTPVMVSRGALHTLTVRSGAPLVLEGATVANETDFDYGLPFRIDGYDPFGGVYRGLTLQVYWDDTAEKVERFVRILDEADYVFVPTNHQYGQIGRLPERYPLTIRYYRELLGCPADRDVIRCYREARPGLFEGRLGYELAAVFENPPRLGPITIEDQSAEEAFTFYDHPKVLVFRKTARFEADRVRASLEQVDLTRVVRLTPRQFDGFSTLMLPPAARAVQQAGGTWSSLFDYGARLNRHAGVAALVWYLAVAMLGLALYPALRLALPDLPDRGYPLARAAGLLILGYVPWLWGSIGGTYSRTAIGVTAIALVAAGALLAWRQRGELATEWRTRRAYYLGVETLFLAAFLAALAVRLANPDMWHPARGGERPMDFSYLNAVLRSTTFPPYDPWFAGGHMNYYYFGFVIAGTLVKLLGVVPSIAYNLLLPTLFAIVVCGAFSLGWNLPALDGAGRRWTRIAAGLAAAGLTVLLGNLGTLRMLLVKVQMLGAGDSFSWSPAVALAQRWAWTVDGIRRLGDGGTLPIHPGEWYWLPSRVVPPGSGNEITEFPLFTFLYGDLHAHLLALPLALLALTWALAAAAGRWSGGRVVTAWTVVFGALVIGALYPTNLADVYTYLPLALAALGYGMWRHAPGPPLARAGRLALAGAALAGLSWLCYLPYRMAYVQAYGALDPWRGPYTPISSYLTHWGLPLFLVVSWMAWETREWLRARRDDASRAGGVRRIGGVVVPGAVLTACVLALRGIEVALVALPLAAWAGTLLMRPSQTDAKRLVLFLTGTALAITLLVELVVVRGDIGRQNTIFKFYLQAWLLLAVSAGAAAAWTLGALGAWPRAVRMTWLTGAVLLTGGAALFTVTATADKVRDRWAAEAPRTLDAATYMQYVQYDDFGRRMDLSQDYRAIRWMQEHVQGTPVIVEAHCPEYRWCSRFTVYTGLPGVVGWNFHQRQQRALVSTWVTDRVAEVGAFYDTEDADAARRFILEHGVRYVVVGQLERAQYGAAGIAKFERLDGTLWKAVYRDRDTVLYGVLDGIDGLTTTVASR